jgi:hypothetical protein
MLILLEFHEFGNDVLEALLLFLGEIALLLDPVPGEFDQSGCQI